jgi:hypothetical protein
MLKNQLSVSEIIYRWSVWIKIQFVKQVSELVLNIF